MIFLGCRCAVKQRIPQKRCFLFWVMKIDRKISGSSTQLLSLLVTFLWKSIFMLAIRSYTHLDPTNSTFSTAWVYNYWVLFSSKSSNAICFVFKFMKTSCLTGIRISEAASENFSTETFLKVFWNQKLGCLFNVEQFVHFFPTNWLISVSLNLQSFSTICTSTEI